MRNFIIILSILFFLLSGVITYKALELSPDNPGYPDIPKEPDAGAIVPESEDVLTKPAGEQASNRALVKELQATIAKLENEISSKNEKMQARTEKPEKKARVLAVLGAGSFSSGQVAVNEGLEATFEDVVRDISASPGHRVVIEGHTDNIPINPSRGKRYMDNMELSFLRAKAVANILVKYGIPLERISVIGYGDTRPVASNETSEGMAKNRRVEIKLVPEEMQ